MPHRVFLHVGLPKSGTTFLQAVLSVNKARLMEAGLLFPGEEGWKSQVRATRDVRKMPHVRFNHRKLVPGSWDRLAAEMRQWAGDSVISMEWLSRAEPDQVQRIMDSLESCEVHVIFTARDLARSMPASWQESVLNRKAWTWEEFLEDVSRDDVPREEAAFWRLHDLVPLIGRWTGAVTPARIHVVTVPRPGAPFELLWERFASVVGVEGVSVDTDRVRRNDGLGLVSTEVLRRLNIRSREWGISSEDHKRLFSHQLAKQGFAERTSRAQRPKVPVALHPWLTAQADRTISGLRSLGVDIVGDLDDLRPDLTQHTEVVPDPSTDELLAMAVDGLVMMAENRVVADRRWEETMAAAEREAQKLQRRLERAHRRHAADVTRWQSRPVRSAAGVLVRRSPLLVRLLRRLRRRAG